MRYHNIALDNHSGVAVGSRLFSIASFNTYRPTDPGYPRGVQAKDVLYIAAFVACLTPWMSPPLALLLGIAMALFNLSRFGPESKKVSRYLIQACVVLLGLRIDLHQLVREASRGLIFAAATIVGAFILGFALNRILRTGKELTLLVSSGTAICGGSAIAAMGSAIGASASAMAVATGAIFILNAVALYAFPAIGHWLHMTDTQFGVWAGVAIHDMSSVVGAGSSYHAADPTSSAALDTANIVKLSRVIWILPCTLFGAWMMPREGAKTQSIASRLTSLVPPFIILFLVASALRTFIPEIGAWQDRIRTFTTLGFAGGLFLIGAGLSKQAVRSVGWRVLVQAIITWVALAAASLAVVMKVQS
jgi:uncharacterized integral membrane protein (TIGR00698 family)